MNKDNTFAFEALSEKRTEEEITITLGRLWSTAKKQYRAVTEVQHEFEAMDLEPYHDISPQNAMAKFMKEVKTYKRSAGPAKFFENQLREHDIRICLDKVVIEEKEIIPIGGSLVALTPVQVTAREVSNLISVYTRVKSGEDLVVAAAEDKSLRAVDMPVLRATHLRRFLKNFTSDVIKARDEMYAKLCNTAKLAPLIYCTHDLYSNEKLAPFRKESDQLLTRYRDEVKKDVEVATKAKRIDKNIEIPAWPKLSTAYTLKQGLFRFVLISEPIKIWRFFLTSCNVRGGQKKLGALSRGYYRFDISAPLITDIEEATDVLMIVKKFSYDAVTLEIADVKLASILVRNGITVYCPAMRPQIEPTDKKVGVWSRGVKKTFLYRANDQEAPSLTKYAVSMPPAVPINGNSPTFVVEYIPDVAQQGCFYLPSCRAAQGLCIKTNVPLYGKKKLKSLPLEVSETITLDDLRRRFCHAVWYRNWFLITRYTYVSQDRYSKFFNNSFILPRIKEVMDEDFFKSGEAYEVGDKSKDIYEVDVTITEQNSVPVYEEVPAPSKEELDELFAVLETYELRALNRLVKDVLEGSIAADDEMYVLYMHYDVDDLLEKISVIRDKLVPAVEKKKVETEETPTVIDDENGDGEELADIDADDFFSGGELREVNKIDALPKEKEEKR